MSLSENGLHFSGTCLVFVPSFTRLGQSKPHRAAAARHRIGAQSLRRRRQPAGSSTCLSPKLAGTARGYRRGAAATSSPDTAFGLQMR